MIKAGKRTKPFTVRNLNINQPPQTPSDSPFRKFDVKCLACGSYQLRLVAQMDEEAGQMSVVLVCNLCRLWEILPVR
jgi:hypothetical protein